MYRRIVFGPPPFPPLHFQLSVDTDEVHFLRRSKFEKHVVKGNAVLVQLLQQTPMQLNVLKRNFARHLLAGVVHGGWCVRHKSGLLVQLQGNRHGVSHRTHNALDLVRSHQLPCQVSFGQGRKATETPEVVLGPNLFGKSEAFGKQPRLWPQVHGHGGYYRRS